MPPTDIGYWAVRLYIGDGENHFWSDVYMFRVIEENAPDLDQDNPLSIALDTSIDVSVHAVDDNQLDNASGFFSWTGPDGPGSGAATPADVVDVSEMNFTISIPGQSLNGPIDIEFYASFAALADATPDWQYTCSVFPCEASEGIMPPPPLGFFRAVGSSSIFLVKDDDTVMIEMD